MTHPWNRLSLLERALSLRIAALALEKLTATPDRTLESCLLEWARRVPHIVEEHLPWLEVRWASGDAEAVQRWCRNAYLGVEQIAATSERLLEQDALPEDVLREVFAGAD